MSTLNRYSKLALVVLALPVGCKSSDDAPVKITAAQTRTEAASRAADIVKQLGGSFDFVTADGSVLSKLAGSAGGVLGGGSSGSPTPMPLIIQPPLPRPIMDELSRSPAIKAYRSPFPSFTTRVEQMAETASDIEVLLRDRLLAPENIESMTDYEITYLLKGDPTCKPLPSSLLPGEVATVDAECAANLMALQVRIVVSADGDGARFQILLGPGKFELSVIIIHSDSIAVESDLAQARRAGNFANKALNTDAGMDPFTKLSGKIRAEVKKLGEKKVAASFSVLNAIDAEVSDPHISFKTAKSDPLFSLTADGVAETATLKLAVGQTDVMAPWDPNGTAAANQDLAISLGGLTGETTLAEKTDQLQLTGVGFGASQSFVAVKGKHIFELDLNKSDGRKFSVKINVGANDQPRFEVTPKFDLSLAFKLKDAGLADAPSFLLDDTYGIVLSGASPSVLEGVKENGTTFKGGLKVGAGMLVLSASSNAAATVTVPTGRCLTGKDMADVGSHEILGHLTVVDCPAQ